MFYPILQLVLKPVCFWVFFVRYIIVFFISFCQNRFKLSTIWDQRDQLFMTNVSGPSKVFAVLRFVCIDDTTLENKKILRKIFSSGKNAIFENKFSIGESLLAI